MTEKELVLSERLAPMMGRMLYSHAVKVGNTIYVSGQVSRDKEHRICHKRDFLGQAEMALQNMKDVLEVAGATMQDVVKLNFFMRHLWDLRRITPIFTKYFGDHIPAMTAVEVVQLWHPHILVEIEAIAVVGEKQVVIDGKVIEGTKYGKKYDVPED